MDLTARFVEYAQAFEETFVDDDWSRLGRFFSPDAVYTVRGGPTTPRLAGPPAIFRGLKKSLDGFDRKFAKREVAFVGEPQVSGDTLSAPWTATYRTPGKPEFVLRGKSTARYRDGLIVELADDMVFDDATMAWFARHGEGLDPSYE